MREIAMLEKLDHPNLIKIYLHPQQYENVIIMEMQLQLESVTSFAN
jgi:hypothetical protein